MITKGEILLIPLVLTLFLCRAVMGLFKEMDKNLNYSMKKKSNGGYLRIFTLITGEGNIFTDQSLKIQIVEYISPYLYLYWYNLFYN